MKRVISEDIKCKFLHILTECKNKRVKNYTQKECAEYMECSLKTFVNFESGKIFDFWLLCDFAEFIGIKIDITYETI
jgi:DNA-binding XRE family transcriptional regulator